MTGEMHSINRKGEDSNGESWPVHATVAGALRCFLQPFDAYIGPYIAHPKGKIFISMEEDGRGVMCLWPGGVAPAYREPIVEEYFPWDNTRAATWAARSVLRRAAQRP